jgi:hypothetical protein
MAPAETSQWLSPLLKKLGGVFLTAVALFGGYAAVVGLLPHISVSDRDTSPAQPLSAIFTITNQSPLPIYDIDMHCFAAAMSFTGNRGVSEVVLDGIPHAKTLGAWKSTDTIPCKVKAANNVLEAADFYLVVCFRPKAWPFIKSDVTRFTTIQIAGRKVWMQNAPATETDTPPPGLGDEVCDGNFSTLKMGPKAWLDFDGAGRRAAHKIRPLPMKGHG